MLLQPMCLVCKVLHPTTAATTAGTPATRKHAQGHRGAHLLVEGHHCASRVHHGALACRQVGRDAGQEGQAQDAEFGCRQLRTASGHSNREKGMAGLEAGSS